MLRDKDISLNALLLRDAAVRNCLVERVSLPAGMASKDTPVDKAN